ncbi:4-hydroxythreonine-4-phosphate dehydrogenase PdxA [Pelagibacteraceae bacterium]|nr:4-hydroxythreonine-4-phosphate dehydrogenase PdxA [Pelagibacteraceae bacterium]
MKKKIILISGDPNSINSEIIYKSWQKINKTIRKRVYLISNYDLINDQFLKLKYKIKTKRVKNINEILSGDELKIINVNLDFNNTFKVNKSSASKFVNKTLDLAHKYGLKNNVSGIINCPINKNLLNKEKVGVTEDLAFKCGIKNKSEVMLIRNKKISVSPITTHIDVKDISKQIKKEIIIIKIKTINKWFKKLFKRKPRIGILGLNPHNAEFRDNSEENNEIIPAIKELKKIGIKLDGPLSSDTVFINNYKNYDVIVGMYHDQVLTPFKALFKFDAINITLGLKYLRISPDHGVATNLIGKKQANPKSLISCIDFLDKFGK